MRIVSPNNSQSLLDMQHTRQADTLTEQQIKYRDITSYSPQLRFQEAIKQSKNNNPQGPDKQNIRHLKHIDPLGLAFLTSMLKTALNINIITHIWKLTNIVPIPNLNKAIDKGTSCRPISLLSAVAKALEKKKKK